jgi:hypothetical protein
MAKTFSRKIFRFLEGRARSKPDKLLQYITKSINMPLVKLFARSSMAKAVPLASLQSKLCGIWGTKPDTTKLMLFRCEDWTDESFQEDIYVDIRAYGTLRCCMG